MHFALLIIFTNLSMATLPSLGHPSEWSTLPRNELNPSARTQVPCAQYFSFAHLSCCSSLFHFSFFDLLKKQTSFFTIQSSISLNLSCSSGLQSVTTVRTRSSKSFTCWKGSTKAFWHFNEKQMKNKQDIIKNMILRQSLWKWSLWHEVSLAWEVGGVPRRPATIKINSQQMKYWSGSWNTCCV